MPVFTAERKVTSMTKRVEMFLSRDRSRYKVPVQCDHWKSTYSTFRAFSSTSDGTIRLRKSPLAKSVLRQDKDMLYATSLFAVSRSMVSRPKVRCDVRLGWKPAKRPLIITNSPENGHQR